MEKIALVIPMLQPYRISFYEELVRTNPDKEIQIFHGITNNSGRPSYTGDVNFKTEAFFPKRFNVGPLSITFNQNLFEGIKKFNPDFIIMYGNPGVATNHFIARWANKNDVAVCLWVCSWDSGKSKGIFRTLKNILSEKYYDKANSFIAYSSHARNYLIAHGQDRDKILIAYNGLDIREPLQKYDRVLKESLKLRKKHDIDNKFLFLYVGGLLKQKKVSLLIQAFKKLDDSDGKLELWIVGDGPEKDNVQSQIDNFEQIKYWGRIVDGVDKYFAAADCFVLPGAGGLALNQSFFWKTPCISSFADGSEEDLVIDGETGFRFQSGNKDDLAKKMEYMLKLNNCERERLGENGQNLIKNRSNTDEMLKVFNNVISKTLDR